MFEDLIQKLKQRAPPKKEGGGFFSGNVNSIEYGDSINVNQLKQDLNLKDGDFEVAGINKDYIFAMDREYLYCRSGTGWDADLLPPSDNVNEFEISRTSDSAAMGMMKAVWETYAIPLRKIEKGVKLSKSCTLDGGFRINYTRLRLTLVDGKIIEFNLNKFVDMHLHFLDILFQEIQETLVEDEQLEQAKRHEKLLEFDQASEIYKKLGLDNDVIRVRKEARNKVSQTIVHGDYIDDRDTTYVDDRDTIIQDSVVSKSNIGAGGKSKAEELREAKALLDEGLINEDDYEKMKKEILGK